MTVAGCDNATVLATVSAAAAPEANRFAAVSDSPIRCVPAEKPVKPSRACRPATFSVASAVSCTWACHPFSTDADRPANAAAVSCTVSPMPLGEKTDPRPIRVAVWAAVTTDDTDNVTLPANAIPAALAVPAMLAPSSLTVTVWPFRLKLTNPTAVLIAAKAVAPAAVTVSESVTPTAVA